MWVKPFFFIVSLFITLNDSDFTSGDIASATTSSNNTVITDPNNANINNNVTTTPNSNNNANTSIDDETNNSIENGTKTQNESFIDSDITLHLMLASHTDAGWVYTFEEYYQGQTMRNNSCVKCIFDNVMDAFESAPDRKYDLSEISYFNRWWTDQNETQRNAVKEFIKNQQLGFMNGAWVANDEATAYYDDIMDNFILGHRWLKDNLDIDTNVGWQVDSFGNSATHAGLMAQAGYDGLFFSRADYNDRENRKKEKSLQFNWAPPNPHNESVFTQMMYSLYSDSSYVIRPMGQCTTLFCYGNLTDPQYDKVEQFMKQQAEWYKTKNVLVLICGDFLMSRGAENFFKGSEAMIKYFEERPEKGIKVRYSHLTDYLAQVKTDMIAQNLVPTIPTKHDDTFPYIEKVGHVWTGYFTSKSMYKMFVREFSVYYNAVKLFLTKELLRNDVTIVDPNQSHSNINQALYKLEQALSIAQHHDSVTGTMKNYVREDYERIINEAKSSSEQVLKPIMVKYLNQKIDETLTPVNVEYGWLFQDGNYTRIFDSDQTPTFAVFNPGSRSSLLINVKVPHANYTVLNRNNEEVSADIICHGKSVNNDCFIYFVDDFVAYSTNVYKLIKSSKSNELTATTISKEGMVLKVGESVSFGVSDNMTDFEYKYCLNQDSCTSDAFHLNYYYYPSSFGGDDKPPSGAYIFNPASETKILYSNITGGRVFIGKYVTILQIFHDKLRTDIKLVYHQPERGLEIDTYLDPVEEIGKEIVLVVRSKTIKNGDTVFYTDSNGYFMQKRVKDYKEGYNISVNKDIAINYYPMTSNMYIEDLNSTQRLSLVTDRAQGVSSLSPGEIEVMIHRVTMNDDWKGVDEKLHEKDSKTGEFIRVTTRHFISFSQTSVGIKDQRRQQQYDLDRAPHLWFFTSKNNKFEAIQNYDANELVLPNLVKLFVRSYQPNEYIIRLNNLDDNETKRVEIYDSITKECSLLNKFASGQKGYKVESVRELSWMTTKEKSEITRNILDSNPPNPMSEQNKDYSIIDLVPMEIRTFSIKIQAQ